MSTIENIFEGWKATYKEDTPQTEEQSKALEEMVDAFDKKGEQDKFDYSIGYARASEKAGFIRGFQMAMDILKESVFRPE